MIDRSEFAEEILLRENIRKAIKIVQNKRHGTTTAAAKQDEQLRLIVRGLIKEAQSAVASIAKHDSTGINALENLLKNTNLLSVLETGYKSLTTDKAQRQSYQNHILANIEKALAPEESRKEAGEDEELGAPIDEDVDIEISDRPEDDPDFISVEDEVEEEPETDPRDDFGLQGEDKTGRNVAYDDFKDVEKIILTAYDNLDNPQDTAMFQEYLLKNLALYFEKFETELDPEVEVPAAAADAERTPTDAGVDNGIDLETDTPEFELEEVLNLLDIDDIIENLL
jgi:hypothetical protein